MHVLDIVSKFLNRVEFKLVSLSSIRALVQAEQEGVPTVPFLVKSWMASPFTFSTLVLSARGEGKRQWLCKPCHVQTTSYGDHKQLQ